jgi:hypothetical protein
MSMPPTEPADRARASSTTTALAATVLAGVLTVALAALIQWFHPDLRWHDDYQNQFLPAFQEIGRCLLTGELPLLTPHSWFSGALAGEYQYGLFNVFSLAVLAFSAALDLSLRAHAALISLTHVFVLGSGAFALARFGYRVSAPGAVIVALAAALNGWILVWGAGNWIPALVSFAWLPWSWLLLKRVVERRRSLDVALAAFAMYLLLSAGWPFTVLMMGLVGTMLAVRAARLPGGRTAVLLLAASAVLALGLASPALLSLVEYFHATMRSLESFHELHWTWTVPPAGLLGLVTPFWTTWTGFSRSMHLHPSFELVNGTVPVVIILITIWRRRGSVRELITLPGAVAAITLLLCLSPSAGTFRWSFRWLPLFHLSLTLAAVLAWEKMRAERPVRLGPVLTLCVIVTLILNAMLNGVPDVHGRALIVALVAIGLLLSAAERLLPSRRGSTWAIPLAMALMLVACYATLPRLPFGAPVWPQLDKTLFSSGPFERDRLYLGLYALPDTAPKVVERGETIRPANLPMLAGLHFVNGYSPMKLRSLHQTLAMGWRGHLHPRRASELLAYEGGPKGLLSQMGVDGLLVPDHLWAQAKRLEERGWTVVHRSKRASVLHRNGDPTPRVYNLEEAFVVDSERELMHRLFRQREAWPPFLLVPAALPHHARFAPVDLTDVEVARYQTNVRVGGHAGDGPHLVVFARPWYPGFRAELDGEPLPVWQLNLLLPAVVVPPAAEPRTLRLVYDPLALRLGIPLAALTVVGLLALGLIRRGKTDAGNSHDTLTTS